MYSMLLHAVCHDKLVHANTIMYIIRENIYTKLVYKNSCNHIYKVHKINNEKLLDSGNLTYILLQSSYASAQEYSLSKCRQTNGIEFLVYDMKKYRC